MPFHRTVVYPCHLVDNSAVDALGEAFMKRILLAISMISVWAMAACGAKPAAEVQPAQVASPQVQAEQAAPVEPPQAPAAQVDPAAQAATGGTQPAGDPTGAVPAAPAGEKKYQGEPGRQFIVTDLHVGPNRAIDAGDIKIKNPDALKLRVSPNSEIAPPGNPAGNDVQTPTTSGLRRPPFKPRANDGTAPAQGQAQGN